VDRADRSAATVQKTSRIARSLPAAARTSTICARFLPERDIGEGQLHRPVKEAARELIVLELYRQGEASSGKAAELLGMERGEFIRYSSARGIPYLQISGEELRREVEDSQAL
jgi:predicted HTH domain antitoxin